MYFILPFSFSVFFKSVILLAIAVVQLCPGALATPTNDTGLIEAKAPAQFVHPGVLLDTHQLNFIRSKVRAKIDPWYTAHDALRRSSFGAFKRRSHSRADVSCGFYNKPNYGCLDEVYDALSAHATALLWIATGDKKYAQKSIEYMNSWAKVIKSHSGKNKGIQTGWAGVSWARAAEIIRYTYSAWASKDLQRFERMLRDVYLPVVIKGAPPRYNGNWDLVMAEAAQGIAVFLNDRASCDEATARYHARVPAYIYLRSDGRSPKTAPSDRVRSIRSYWNGQSKFPVDGICQETCRDLVHTGSGLSSVAHVAETSRIQGSNLYHGDVGHRLRSALELHSYLQMYGNSEK